jgi:regulator of RNase E activity RraA
MASTPCYHRELSPNCRRGGGAVRQEPVTTTPNAPLTADELEALRRLTTPTISNAIETFKARPRNEGFMDPTVRCLFPELGPVAGYAVTAKITARERSEKALPPWEMWAAMERVPKPRLVVIEDLDYPSPVGSYWGEVNGSIYQGLGCAGTVTNGGVRDLDEVRATGFHFFASCVLVSHAYVHLVEVGTPVRVGGLEVKAGDLLHGDQHGVIAIPVDIARDIPRAAEQIEAYERRIIDFARSPECGAQGLRQLFTEGRPY